MFLHTLAKTSDTISNATTSTFISCFLMFKKYILREKKQKNFSWWFADTGTCLHSGSGLYIMNER